MYFRLATLKIPPPNVISPIFFCNLFSLWAPPMILLTAGALTDPQLPARASNVYTTEARVGGIGWVASAGWHRPGGIDRVASTGWHRPGAPSQTKILATPVLPCTCPCTCQRGFACPYFTGWRVHLRVLPSALRRSLLKRRVHRCVELFCQLWVALCDWRF